MTSMTERQIVWFLEKPTIGYCPNCGTTAIYREGKGLICPDCGTTKLSLFEWDGTSRDPEDESDEVLEEEEMAEEDESVEEDEPI